MTTMICRDCGTVGDAKRAVKGSAGMELVLWLCFLVPGLIYSMWRVSTKYDACRACRSPHLVPVDSPIGRKLATEFGTDVDEIVATDKAASIRRGRILLAIIVIVVALFVYAALTS